MPQRGQMDYMDIIFKKGIDRRECYTYMYQRLITHTRYADDTCLCSLGLYDNGYWVLNRFGWDYFVTLRHQTYERMTLELLSSFSSITHPAGPGSNETA